MIQSDLLRFLKRLTELAGLRTEALAKRHPPAPRKTGQLISGIAFRRVSDFRGVVETSRNTESYAPVQEFGTTARNVSVMAHTRKPKGRAAHRVRAHTRRQKARPGKRFMQKAADEVNREMKRLSDKAWQQIRPGGMIRARRR